VGKYKIAGDLSAIFLTKEEGFEKTFPQEC